MTQQPPQKRYLVQSSFYVFADDAKDLDSQLGIVKKKMEAHIDGANMTIGEIKTLGFAELVKY